MSRYNGYKSWAQWNVSLWINNDEALYRTALYWIFDSDTKDIAAEKMLSDLKGEGLTHTPDGAKYSVTSIRKAIVGMEA